MNGAATISAIRAEADTRRWLEVAVIGLNLCPFAKVVHVRKQIHYDIYVPREEEGLLDALLDAARSLMSHEPSERETTLLIAPNTLANFLDFNHFTSHAEGRLTRAGFKGRLQLASFHPHYQFAGTEADDITNATNRSPYPTLHLLREESVGRAVDTFPDAEAIFGRNIQTLEALGTAGWNALNVGPGGAAQ